MATKGRATTARQKADQNRFWRFYQYSDGVIHYMGSGQIVPAGRELSAGEYSRVSPKRLKYDKD